jgi:Iap family predicted aminopeptidase
MKSLIYSCLVSWLLLSCSEPEQPKADLLARINAEVLANSRAYAELEEATTKIGHRLTGSANGTRAEQFVYDKLKSYGFKNVQFQEFTVDAWSRGTVQLTLNVAGNVASVPTVSLGHSPVEARVTGAVVDMGNGLARDYDNIGDNLAGKIALVFIGITPGTSEGAHNLHRSEKTALAIDNGAIGVIIYNKVPNGVLLTGTASVNGSLLAVPAICIGYEDGIALKEMLAEEESVLASINMTNQSGPIKARNVIATLPGSEIAEEIVIVGGHLDSWDLATGAIDNGIGSFAVLDIARTFMANNLHPKRTVKFVLFMGEEQGLLGSKYMVARAGEDGSLGNIKFMMNLDMTGNPVGMNASGYRVDTTFFADLGAKIHELDTIYQAKFTSRAGLHSDHQPFMLAGVPILSMHSNLDRSIYRCYHADCDDFGLVNEAHIRNTTRFGSMALYSVANADILPAQPMSSEQTRQFMIDNDLEDNLKMQGDWKWD